MKRPKISVLMPAYNSELYISEAIESILNQTYKDFEFLIINDGSTDKTAQIIQEYAKQDLRIRFINNIENKGLIAVLNQGLELCNGKYIARMDSDDISLPTRFEKQIIFLEENPNVGVLGTAGQNFGANDDVHFSPQNVDIIELLRGVGFYHPSVMIRKSVLDTYNLKYDKKFYLTEDHELWSRMLNYTKLCNLQEVLIRYRVHSASVSVTNSELQEKNKRIIRQRLLDSVSMNSEIRVKLLELAGLENNKEENFKQYSIINFLDFIPLITFVRKKPDNLKIFLFNIFPLIKIKQKRVYLFHFLRIGKLRDFFSMKKSLKNYYSYDIDNNYLLSQLNKMGSFTFIPNSGNMGDMLIASSTLMFFDKYHIKYKFYNNNIDANIVYGGGGQWTSDYKEYWQKWINVFEKAKKILILPSSFHNCQELIDIMDERFTVFCREEKSYNYLKSFNTKANIFLDHDMAFRMNLDKLPKKYNKISMQMTNAIKTIKGMLPMKRCYTFFMRSDCESRNQYYSDIDISSLLYGKATSSRKYIDCCTSLMLMAINNTDIVITDRLHVAIAGSLLGKEVCMLDNTYGKLSSVYNRTMKSNPNVHLFENMNEVEKFLNGERNGR